MASFFPALRHLSLSSSRLLLRPYQMGDARVLHRFVAANEARMIDYLPMTVEENRTPLLTRRFIRNRRTDIRESKTCFLGIFLPSGELIGQIALRELNLRVPKCEIGYVIAEAHTRNGYAREALETVCNWAFEVLNMQKVSLRIEPINLASARVAVACGFQQIALLRNDFRTTTGRLMDAELWERLS